MKIRIIASLLILSLLSCKTEDLEIINLASEVTGFEDYLGKSNSITVSGDYLVVEDDQVETAYTIFDLGNDTATPIYTGYKGAGPNELIKPMPVVPDEDNFYVYDISHFKLFHFNTDSVKHAKAYKPSNCISIDENFFISDIKKVSEDAFVAVGIFPEKRFAFIDNNGKIVKTAGAYPLEQTQTEQLPFHVKGMACLSKLTTNPAKKIIVSALFYGDKIQFYKVSDDYRMVLLNQHHTFMPEFSTNNSLGMPNFSPTKETRWGYLSLTSNPKFVYALYSGKYQRQGNDFYQNNIVHVFDWYGERVSTFKLDKSVLSIASTSKHLYALYEGDNGYEILKYQL